MSRLAKKPIPVPAGVSIERKGRHVSVTGKSSRVTLEVPDGVDLELSGDAVYVAGSNRSGVGLCWALLRNAVGGCVDGYTVDLEVQGVGYQIVCEGSDVVLNVGYANRIRLPIPDGLTATCPDATHLKVRGADRQLVGQFCADVRGARPPEPYKGKGVRYTGEVVRRKEGKAFGAK